MNEELIKSIIEDSQALDYHFLRVVKTFTARLRQPKSQKGGAKA